MSDEAAAKLLDAARQTARWLSSLVPDPDWNDCECSQCKFYRLLSAAVREADSEIEARASVEGDRA